MPAIIGSVVIAMSGGCVEVRCPSRKWESKSESIPGGRQSRSNATLGLKVKHDEDEHQVPYHR